MLTQLLARKSGPQVFLRSSPVSRQPSHFTLPNLPVPTKTCLFYTLPGKVLPQTGFQASRSSFLRNSFCPFVSLPSRAFHSSSSPYSKGTTAIRRKRASEAIQTAVQPKQATLFEFDSRTFFRVLTGIAVLQGVFFLGAAEFYWQYDISVIDGLNAGSNLLSRLVWPGFFALVGTFIPITRHFFGTRYINKLEVQPNGELDIYTYDFWARSKLLATVPIKALKPKQFNDQGDYYKIKIGGFKWFFIMDKRGTIKDKKLFDEVMSGKTTGL